MDRDEAKIKFISDELLKETFTTNPTENEEKEPSAGGDPNEAINKIYTEVSTSIQQQGRKLKKQFKKDIEEIHDEFAKKVEKLENKTEDSKLSIIETLGIFVALFTFVSVEFQIFRSFTSWKSGASLSLIILGALLLFIVTMDLVLHKKMLEKLTLVILVLASISIIFGIVLFGKSTLNNPEYISLEAKDLNAKIELLNSTLLDLKDKINQNSEEFRLFKKCLQIGSWNKCF